MMEHVPYLLINCSFLRERLTFSAHTHMHAETHVLTGPLATITLCWTAQLSLCFLLSLAEFSSSNSLSLIFPNFSLWSRFPLISVRVHIVRSVRIRGTDVVSFFCQSRSSLRRAFDILNLVITSVCHRFFSPRKESSSLTCPCVILHNFWFWACFSLCAVHSVHLHPQTCIYFSTLNITVFCTLVKKISIVFILKMWINKMHLHSRYILSISYTVVLLK